jgi:hypothetical protein
MDKTVSQPPSSAPLPLSQRIAQIIEGMGTERLSFSDLAAQLHARAWGALLFIFAAINVLPLPPGTSWIFATPLVLVSAQMVFGRAAPWFPKRIDRRGITRQQLELLMAKIEWIELRVEKIFRPRLASLTGPTATRLIGVVCFLLGIAAAIPIPLFHMAPAAAAVLFGLALIYRDGALVIVAIVASLLSIAVDALIIGSGVVALSWAASWFRL